MAIYPDFDDCWDGQDISIQYTSSPVGTNKPKRYQLSAKVLQDTKSNYDTDIFGPLLAAVHDLVGGGWRVQCICWTLAQEMSKWHGSSTTDPPFIS